MHYLVLDLEWNISTKRAGEQASDQEIKEEIIEIGAVCLDSAFEPADRFSVDVKPRYHKKMHSYIGRLIQRENDSLKEGLPFPEAIQKFRAWLQGHGIEDYIFCTWSTSDSGPWLENMRHYGLFGKEAAFVPECAASFCRGGGAARKSAERGLCRGVFRPAFD